MIRECFDRDERKPVALTFAHSVAEASATLVRESFDFVLLDHNLPDGTGADVLEACADSLLTTPVIGLSTSADPTVALSDMRAGAIDFIEKHEAFQGDTLRRRVFEIISDYKRRTTAVLLEQRRKNSGIDLANEQLIAAARLDGLMNIFNRAAFEDLHAELHERALSTTTPYALCLVDVDSFKKYNDHYGHLAGDDALRAVVAALRGALRPNDVVARFGGEELVVLLDEADREVLDDMMQRLCSLVAGLERPHEHSDHGVVTVSIGGTLCCIGGDQPDTGAAVLKRADQALYDAKASGRNTARTRLFEDQPSAREAA